MSLQARLAALGAAALLGCQDASEPVAAGGGLLLRVESPAGNLALDSGEVILDGPTDTIVKGTPGSAVTIAELTPGSYTVTLVGFSGTEVERFGRTTNVQVVAGQTASPTVSFNSFLPPLGQPKLTADGSQFTVSFDAVTAADSYHVDVDSVDGLALTQHQMVTGTSATFPIDGRFGTYQINVRAFEPYKHVGRRSSATAAIVLLGSDAAADGFVTNAGGVGTINGLFAGDADASSPGLAVRGFVSFDLGSLPTDATIPSAILRLRQVQVTGTPYAGLGDLLLDHLDYSPALDPGDYGLAVASLGTLSSTPDLEYKPFDVSSSVAADHTADWPSRSFGSASPASPTSTRPMTSFSSATLKG